MSKTITPTAGTFFAFACQLETHINEVDDAFPSWMPAIGEAFQNDSPPLLAEYINDKHAEFLQALVAVERKRLLDAGFDEAALTAPSAIAYIEQNAYQQCYIVGLHDWSRRTAKRSKSTSLHAERRKIAIDVIVGTYLALGDGNRAKTAKFLNEGAAAYEKKAYLVTPSEVRNALDSFVQSVRHDIPKMRAIGAGLKIRAHAARRLWTGPVDSQGDLLSAYASAVAEAPVSNIGLRDLRDLSRRSVAVVDRLIARRAAA